MTISPNPIPSIFISYSHKNSNFCMQLLQDLRHELGNNVQLWPVSDEPLDDEEWKRIRGELKASDIFIVLLSPHAVSSPLINSEMDIAWGQRHSARGMLILPIMYELCEVREDFKTIQIVSFLGPRLYQSAFRELLNSIKSWQEPSINSYELTRRSKNTRSNRHTSRFMTILIVITIVIMIIIAILWKAGLLLPQTPVRHQEEKYGIQPCPSSVSNPYDWNNVVGVKIGSFTRKIENVTCGYLIGKNSLQALVTERGGSGGILSVYVYDAITTKKPLLLFTLDGMTFGSAKISDINTVITSEVDAGSTINIGKADAFLKPDLYREFAWSDAKGAFIQINFPGIFPDLTRYQAVDDQEQVKHGADSWKLNATATASHFTQKFFQWGNGVSTKVLSGSSNHDLDGVIYVRSSISGADSIKITLKRDTTSCIWEVVSAGSDKVSVDTTTSTWAVIFADANNVQTVSHLDHIENPLVVGVECTKLQGWFGIVVILDHLYNDIGHTDLACQATNPYPYPKKLDYATTFPGEEGVVAIYGENVEHQVTSVIMTKVLL